MNLKEKDALVLFSGGQDSTTCLYWAIENFNYVRAIGFDYGQMHARELEQAKLITDRTGVPYKILNIKNLLAPSSLIDHSDHSKPSSINKDLPASFTPGRNILFLTIAASFATENKINDLVTGVCQTDYSGYPDCRRTTIDAMQTTLSLGIGTGDFRIHTPLMYLTKAETWKLANDLGCLDIIINDTLTDYDGDLTKNEWGYGKETNPATKLRAKGYREAKEKGWI